LLVGDSVGCDATQATQEGTFEMKRNPTRPAMSVTTGGKGVVSHVGARLLCDLADEVGLTGALSVAMAPTKKRRRGHDRGGVLVDLAVALADGAKTISDLRSLSNLNRPGIHGGSIPWKRGWSHAEGTVTGQADDSSVYARGEGAGGTA